ncbi:MAG: M15 family peptidase [Spirochaetaceae bacterium]|nr:MAG: M15 family peptidase [Spirochaetaceae bacterium]
MQRARSLSVGIGVVAILAAGVIHFDSPRAHGLARPISDANVATDLAAELPTSARPDRSAPELAPSDTPETTDPTLLPGAIEVDAMLRSYPGRFTRSEVRDGEWAIEMDGQWYYWAQGRLLPSDLRAQAEHFIPIRFYRYDLGPISPRVIDDELAEQLRTRGSAASGDQGDGRMRFNGFLDALYGISSERDAEFTVVPTRFLGFRTRVHPILVEPLERVERRIRVAMLSDDALRGFVEGLAVVSGYNWRNIAGTLRRSYHSYGVAVDLVPTSYQGRWAYWLWAAQGGIDEWWDIPLAARWTVPDAIVDAFEQEGFIWGGKWLSFDNLHFEYRPEAILMAQERERRVVE